MKKIFSIMSIMVFATFLSCEDYDTGLDAPESLSFVGDTETVNFLPESPVHTIRVYATRKSNVDRTIVINNITDGTNPNTNAPYSSAVDGDYTVSSSTVIIPAGELSGSFDVQFNAAIPLGVSRFTTFQIEGPEEGYILNKTSNEVKVTYTPKCLLNLVNFELNLDRWGSETTWNLKDGSGNVIASGGPYTDAATNVIQALPIMKYCLADGNYTFTINDSYGDGMVTNATVIGSYKLTRENGTVLVQGLGSGFVNTISHSFSLP